MKKGRLPREWPQFDGGAFFQAGLAAGCGDSWPRARPVRRRDLINSLLERLQKSALALR